MLADRLGPRDPLFAFGERGAHGLGALGTLNGISAELRRELGSLASLSSCPAGAILFVEEQMPDLIFRSRRAQETQIQTAGLRHAKRLAHHELLRRFPAGEENSHAVDQQCS